MSPARSARPTPTKPRLPLDWWGSECTDCSNATHGSMTCDDCGSSEHTKALWMEEE